MAPPLFIERLYLSREHGAEVYVPEQFTMHLRPYQRDGIRFLHRLFAKKSPGAILNDPAASGKTVQAVLFVDAVSRSLHPLPALILCSPEDVSYWKYHFHLWTDSANEIAADGVSKEVLVSSIYGVSELIRREWGIVVVDHDIDIQKSLLKQLKALRAQFKVWLSNENLWKNVTGLASIQEWITNNDEIDLSLFEKVNSKRQKVEQAIARDIFTQNFILRRTNEDLPLASVEENMELFETWKINKTLNRSRYFKSDNFQSNAQPRAAQPSASVTPVVSIKNKDATGMKIKRSKAERTNGTTFNRDLPDTKVNEETEMFIKKTRINVFEPMLIDQEDLLASEHEELLDSVELDHHTKITKPESPLHSSIRRIEELADKQFKGSILDSLF